MKLQPYTLILSIIWTWNAFGIKVPTDLRINRKLLVLTGSLPGSPYIVGIQEGEKTCSGVVVKAGIAISMKGCASDASKAAVCTEFAEKKACTDKMAVTAVDASHESLIAVTFVDSKAIAPAEIGAGGVAKDTDCSIFGLGPIAADGDPGKPLGAAVKLGEGMKVPPADPAAADTCTGDEGGALVCGTKVEGLIQKVGDCTGAKEMEFLDIAKCKDFIANLGQAAETTVGVANDTTENATASGAAEEDTTEPPSSEATSYMRLNFIAAIFPAIILMLIFP